MPIEQDQPLRDRVRLQRDDERIDRDAGCRAGRSSVPGGTRRKIATHRGSSRNASATTRQAPSASGERPRAAHHRSTMTDVDFTTAVAPLPGFEAELLDRLAGDDRDDARRRDDVELDAGEEPLDLARSARCR